MTLLDPASVGGQGGHSVSLSVTRRAGFFLRVAVPPTLRTFVEQVCPGLNDFCCLQRRGVLDNQTPHR